ncbi:alpha-1,2-fucosyltransferase [soil metagenome]
MIAVQLGGGIGNQLFQYAAARALALRLGVPLALDLRLFDNHAARRYALDAFAIETVEIDRNAFPPSARRLSGQIASWFRARRRFATFRERRFTFDPDVPALPDWTWLAGNFQSERYFADQAAVLRRDLALRRPPEGKNRAIHDAIAGSLAVSLHVRRGDYVTNPRANAVHGLVGADFYRNAVQYVADRAGGAPAVFVFTDDPDWVAASLDIGCPFTLVRHNLAGAEAEDLRLMAACRHHIVANSSFSWWGAWLDASPDSMVIAPRPWFRDAAMDDSSLIPERWIRLP